MRMLSCLRCKRKSRHWINTLCFVTLSTILPAGFCNVANAADSSAPNMSEAFAIQVKMQQLNTQLHLKAAMTDFKRQRRTWLWDFGNGSATEGGLIAATCLFWNHNQDKLVVQDLPDARVRYVHNRIDGNAIAGTIYPQIAGQGVGVAGALYELVCDSQKSFYLRKNDLDAKSVIKKMVALNDEFDRAMANDNGQTDLERRLLLALRDAALHEFVRLEGRAGRIVTANYIEDGVSLTRNTVGIIGNALNAAANINYDKHMNANGNVLNVIAASMISLRPFATNGASIVCERVNARRVRKHFPACKLDQSPLDEAEKALADLKESKDVDKGHLDIGKCQHYLAFLREQTELSQVESRADDHAALRRYRESLYGPTKIAQSVLGLNIGFRKLHNETSDNRLAAIGNTVYTAGQAGNLSELIRERIVDEMDHRNRSRQGLLPEQILRRQAQVLESRVFE